MANSPVEFFISYTKADRQWAEWIAWQLEQEGYSVIIQSWDFRPGDNFILAMNAAAASADRTIVVLSPDYFTSRFTPSEWAVAFKKDPKGENGIVLPVQVRDCKQQLTGLLSPIAYIDLVGLDKQAAKKKLLDGIHRTRAKPSVEPDFPGSTSF